LKAVVKAALMVGTRAENSVVRTAVLWVAPMAATMGDPMADH